MTRHIKYFRYYKEWIETYKKGFVRNVTYEKYKITLNFIIENFPDLYLDAITRSKFQMIINKYGQTHEHQTTLDFLNQLKRSLRDAYYDGMIKKDPTYQVKTTSQVKHKITRAKYLEAEEANKLERLLKQDNSVVSIICDFDLRTGLRFAEIFGITPKDVDFDNKTVDINKTWNYKAAQLGEEAGFAPTKNKASIRIIDLDDNAIRDLQHVIIGVKQDESIFVKALTIESKNKGTFGRYSQKNRKNEKYFMVYNSLVNTYLTRVCKKAGIPRISCHGLRHTHASLLIANGVSIQSVANRLGHTDTTTTQKTYIHLLKKLKNRDQQKIEKIMDGLG